MGKQKAPAPDPRMGDAAMRQIGLAERQYADFVAPGGDRDFMRGLAERSIGAQEGALGIQRSVADRANALSDYQLGQMRFFDDRYRQVGIPLENELLQEVRNINPDQLAGQAAVGARRELGIAKDIRRRDLERRGVNPFSARALGDSRALAIDEAAAVNSAFFKTKLAAEQLGLANKMQLYGGLKGISGLGNVNAGIAASALGASSGAANGMGQLGNNIVGAGGTYLDASNRSFNTALGGMSAGVTGLGQFSQLRQNAAEINNNANPFPALLGAGATLGAAWIGAHPSDRRLKTNIAWVGVDERTGLNLYEFSYRGLPGRWRGVMADEVEQRYPDAVLTTDDGPAYKFVNYKALGMEMVPVRMGGA